MPKEITHFALAGQLARALSVNSPFYGPVNKYPNLFLLGAVTPDIPFYYLAGPDRELVQNLSEPFHRRHALAPVLEFLEQDSSSPSLALAAGVVCHIMSDTQFHPLVYYYAGMDEVHKGATGRHRTFETAMDLHFWSLFRGKTSLPRVVKQLEISTTELSRMLAVLFRVRFLLPFTAPMKALALHRSIQFLFRASWIRNGLAWLNRINRPLPEKISGLAYPFDHPVSLTFFNGPVFYQDPCTRKSVYTDIPTLIIRTMESGCRVLDIVAQAMEEGHPETAGSHSDLPLIRPSLDPDRFEIWHGQQDIRPLVYQGVSWPF